MTDSQNSSAKRLPEESESEWTARIKRIRRETVLETLESLGFDVEDVNEMQKDAIFLRKMRTASERMSAKTVAGLIALFFTVAGAIVTVVAQNYWPK